MGLDIYAYKNLVIATDVYVDDEGEIRRTTGEYADEYFRPFVNPDFPGRNEHLDGSCIYSFEDTLHCLQRSYSGYGEFRRTLAKIAGHELDFYWNGGKAPFWQLINFSDCEGVIGPIACGELLADFVQHCDKAAMEDEWFLPCYRRMINGLALAANNGALSFR